MSGLRRIELIEPYPSFFVRESSIFAPKTLPLPSLFVEEPEDHCLALDLLDHWPSLNPTPFDVLDTVTDLIQIERTSPFCSSYRRLEQRLGRLGTDFYLRNLSDRVSALELSFDRLVGAWTGSEDRKYTWEAEIKSPEKHGFDRKYKWTAEIKGGKNQRKKPVVEVEEEEKDEEEEYGRRLLKNYKQTREIKGGKNQKKQTVKVEQDGGLVKNYKWTAEIKGEDGGIPIRRTYTFKASKDGAYECSGSGKKEKKDKKGKKREEHDTHVVEIEEPVHHGAVVLREAFAKRVGADRKCKGKKKELSPLDAALMIQVSFRAYLIRRSQALRALRELAIAKTKLKEIRALFNNFSYRSRVAHDAVERQRFSEKIIVLLLTVDAIEGADMMVRSAKRSMVDELEAMLDVVDPQPLGKSLSMKRRMFDMPNGTFQKDIAAGVAKVVQIIDEEEKAARTFEACV